MNGYSAECFKFPFCIRSKEMPTDMLNKTITEVILLHPQ